MSAWHDRYRLVVCRERALTWRWELYDARNTLLPSTHSPVRRGQRCTRRGALNAVRRAVPLHVEISE